MPSGLRRLFVRKQTLTFNPRPTGAKKLSGTERYRLRQGSYRIIYSIEDDKLTVYVVKVGDRKEIYRAL